MKPDRHTILKAAMVLFLAAYLGFLYFSDYAKNIPMDNIAASMEKETSVTDLQKQSLTDLRRFYQIDGNETDGWFFYKAPSPMSVDEVFIVKGRDKKQTDAFLEKAQKHLSEQKKIFEGYGTDQMALLNEAAVESRGRYVYYMCGEAASRLRKLFLSLI